MIYVRAFLLMMASILSVGSLQGQFADDIRSGRPGQAAGAFGVGDQVLQFQLGAVYENLILPSDDASITNYTAVVRYGITRHLEAGLAIGYRRNDFNSGQVLDGLSTFQAGLRYNLYEGSGAIPSIGVQARATLPFTTGDFERDRVGVTSLLALGSAMSDRTSLFLNLIANYPGGDERINYSYALGVGQSLSERWSAYVEVYGSLSDGITDAYNGGVAFLVSPDVQLDLSVGVTTDQDITTIDGPRWIDSWFIDGGVSVRIDWRGDSERRPNQEMGR